MTDNLADIPDPAKRATESPDHDVQVKLLQAGLLSEIKGPIRDLQAYRDRKPIPITDEPLSAIIIRDRAATADHPNAHP